MVASNLNVFGREACAEWHNAANSEMNRSATLAPPNLELLSMVFD
jgi:hypothetical protein